MGGVGRLWGPTQLPSFSCPLTRALWMDRLSQRSESGPGPPPGAHSCLTREQLRRPLGYQPPVHRDVFTPDQHLLWSHHHPGLGRGATHGGRGGQWPSSSCVQLPLCVWTHLPPHQLTVPRLGTVPPGLEVDGPGGISRARQQVSAAAQEVEVASVEGAIVEAGPGGAGGRGTLVLAPELGHGPRQGLQDGWGGRAAWGRYTNGDL